MKKALQFIRWIFYVSGAFFLIILILSFTDIPFYAYYRLASTDAELATKPDVIVILGGSGMPSPDGLIRSYYGASAANKNEDAKIIIALPYSSQPDSLCQLKAMANELVLKGIDSLRIEYEPFGFNTRSQAINIGKMSGVHKSDVSLLIITSPQHMYRAIKTFQKVGFKHVGSLAAFERPVGETNLENKKDRGSVSLALRYNMWSYLNYEIIVLREYAAIVYYKIKGWI